MSQVENFENVSTSEPETQRAPINYETIEHSLMNMSQDPNLLKSGYTILSSYERNRNFYINFLKVIFSSECNEKVKKLAASSLKIFLSKNWSDEAYITNEERLVRDNLFLHRALLMFYCQI
jgi:hypothetical protein